MLVLALTASLCGVAVLADSDLSLTFDLGVLSEYRTDNFGWGTLVDYQFAEMEKTGKNNLFQAAAGDTVNVAVSLRHEGGSYSLISMQNEVEYDTSFFELADIAVTNNAGAVNATRSDGQDLVKVACLDQTYSAETEVLCIFSLKVRSDLAGRNLSSVIRSGSVQVNTADGKVIPTEQNLIVYIGETYTPSTTVRFSLVGGSMSAARSVAAAVGETITLPTPTRTGYLFIGWSDDGGATTHTDTYTVPEAAGSTLTLTAQWREPYIVTYDLAGGSMSAPCPHPMRARAMISAVGNAVWMIRSIPLERHTRCPGTSRSPRSGSAIPPP